MRKILFLILFVLLSLLLSAQQVSDLSFVTLQKSQVQNWINTIDSLTVISKNLENKIELQAKEITSLKNNLQILEKEFQKAIILQTQLTNSIKTYQATIEKLSKDLLSYETKCKIVLMQNEIYKRTLKIILPVMISAILICAVIIIVLSIISYNYYKKFGLSISL